MLCLHLHIHVFGYHRNALCEDREVVLVTSEGLSVTTNLSLQKLCSILVVTFVPCPHPVQMTEVIIEFLSDFFDSCLELVSNILNSLLKPFNDSLFVHLILAFHESNLLLDNRHCLLDLVVRYLGNHLLHFLFDLLHQLSLFLPIERLALRLKTEHLS